MHNLNSPKIEFEEKVKMQGKITVIWYGFTNAKQQDYMNSRDLPWTNSFGEYKLEGQLQVYFLYWKLMTLVYHLNTAKEMNIPMDKTLVVMNESWIRVPKGKNVVWKVGYDR